MKWSDICFEVVSDVNETAVGVAGCCPGHAGSNYYWVLALLNAARRANIGTLLTGQGGNATVSWTGFPSWGERFTAGRWKEAISYLLPNRVKCRRRIPSSWLQSAIQPTFAARMELAQRYFEEQRTVNRFDPIQARLRLILPGRSMIGDQWALLEAAYGIEVRDPTNDKRLIEFTLSIPDHYFRSRTQDRFLIRHALIGILPDSVRTNQRYGRQSADLGARLRNSQTDVAKAFASIEHSKVEAYLDLKKIQTAFRHSLNNTTPHGTNRLTTIFMRGMDSALYLSNAHL